MAACWQWCWAPPEERGWRGHLSRVTESPIFHLVIIGIVVVDLFLVVTEIAISSLSTAGPETKEALEVLDIMSLVLLVLLNFEWLLLLLVYRLRFFLKWGWIVDALLVSLALALEMVFSEQQDQELQEISSLVLLLFRLLRLLHAVFTISGTYHEGKLHHLQEENARLKEQLRAFQTVTADAQVLPPSTTAPALYEREGNESTHLLA